MAIEIDIPSDSKDPKTGLEFGVIKGNLAQDLKDFIAGINDAIGPQNSADFFKKLGDVLKGSGSIADLGHLSGKIAGVIEEIAKAESSVPTGTTSTENIEVTDNTGQLIDGAEGRIIKQETELIDEANLLNSALPNTYTNLNTNSTKFDIVHNNNGDSIIFDSPSPIKTNIIIDDEISNFSDNLFNNSNKKNNQQFFDILIRNAVPYTLGSIVSGGIGNLTKLKSNDTAFGQLNVNDVLSTTLTARSLLNKKKYLSPKELGFFLGGLINFYTIHFKRGITVKDLIEGPGIEFNILTARKREEEIEFRRRTDIRQYDLSLVEDITGEGNKPASSEVQLENLIDSPNQTNKTTSDEFNIEEGFINKVKHLARERVNDSDHEYEFTRTDINSEEARIKGFGIREVIDIDRAKRYKISPGDSRIRNINEALDILRKKTNVNQVGSIYVNPVGVPETSPTFIPFQFNPMIQEGGRAARYQATTILSRLGNLQSYVGTDSITLNLNTTYYPLAENFSINQSQDFIDSWWQIFDMINIQKIELIYRSLVLPFFTETNDVTNDGYKYIKPPLIKVIMGDKDKVINPESIVDNNLPYSNLLTYPEEILGNNVLSERGNQSARFRHFRTFIVTSVDISKNLEERPIYITPINEGAYIKDTFGFDVSLQMIEITPSYSDRYPSFGDYYKSFDASWRV